MFDRLLKELALVILQHRFNDLSLSYLFYSFKIISFVLTFCIGLHREHHKITIKSSTELYLILSYWITNLLVLFVVQSLP